MVVVQQIINIVQTNMIPCDDTKASSLSDMLSHSRLVPKTILLFLITLLLVSALVFGQVTKTDPYFTDTAIRSPFTTQLETSGQITLNSIYQPQLAQSKLSRALALVRTGLRIPFYSLIFTEKPLIGSESEIISQIHEQRFDPSKPYVITGSHYSDLYMRNMGVFFNALLDPRLPTSDEDWQNRQRIGLQTIAYDLAFLKANQGRAVTTIAPAGDTFAGLNIYRPPSDSLFGVMYSLTALIKPTFVADRFPAATTSASPKTLQTQTATTKLLTENQVVLSAAINHYLDTSLDPASGLIRRDIHLSSARDGIKRESAFYDNVIAWATVQLADELQIPHAATLNRETWKAKILETYWDENLGIFKNDLATNETFFSADSLIVTSTGFFDLQTETDRSKLNRIIAYIQAQSLDQPFPLRYSRSNTSNNMHFTVKYFAPSYMGDGIWSHWGMEYLKALLLLEAPDNDYAQIARKHLQTYGQNIEKFGGYPELYNAKGEMFHSTLLKGVLHTGWVVNYEQTKMMSGTD